MEKKFAIMVEGKQTPSKLYQDFDLANEEATRLAKKEGRSVYILKVIASVIQVSQIKTILH